MRACMAGKAPPPAVERHREDRLIPAKRQFRDRYPFFLLEAVDWAMDMDPAKRPQDAGKLLRALQQYTGELPGSSISEFLHTESASGGSDAVRDQSPDTDPKTRI
jgi:hypothetical protein